MSESAGPVRRACTPGRGRDTPATLRAPRRLDRRAEWKAETWLEATMQLPRASKPAGPVGSAANTSTASGSPLAAYRNDGQEPRGKTADFSAKLRQKPK